LMNSHEASSCIELPDMFILPPQDVSTTIPNKKQGNPNGYSSKYVTPLSKVEIEDLLRKANIILE
jgi:hypothetical protein